MEAIRIDQALRRVISWLHCLQCITCSVLKLNQQGLSSPEMIEQDASKILNPALGAIGVENLM